MQQLSGWRMPMCMTMNRLGLQRVPVFNAVGKPCPLRGQNGQRDQHVLEPAGVHGVNHCEELQFRKCSKPVKGLATA